MSLQQIFYGVAQPIVNQTNAGVSSLSGSISGNSGPGPSGPNLVVSSITFAQNVGGPTAFTQGVLNMSTQLVIQDFGTPVAQDYIFVTNQNVGGSEMPTFTSSFISTANQFIVNGTGGDFANGQLNFAGSVDGRGVIWQQNAGGGLSTLAILADNVNMPTNLNVSSINGQTPGGGGGGPVIGTSSITTSTINFEGTQDSGMFYPPDGKKITSEVGIALTPLTGQYGNSGVVGAWGKEVYQGAEGYGEFAVQRLYLVDATGGATNQTRIENYGNQIQIETTSSISLQADTYVTGSFNTSTINVSSINGGVPALTSLFATLFQANPSLSTIVY